MRHDLLTQGHAGQTERDVVLADPEPRRDFLLRQVFQALGKQTNLEQFLKTREVFAHRIFVEPLLEIGQRRITCVGRKDRQNGPAKLFAGLDPPTPGLHDELGIGLKRRITIGRPIRITGTHAHGLGLPPPRNVILKRRKSFIAVPITHTITAHRIAELRRILSLIHISEPTRPY